MRSSLFPPAERRASTWTQPKIHCLPVTAASVAKCLGALCCSLLPCQPVFPSDWLSWHFLTVSVNHLTVTAYYYGAGRAWAATWRDSLSLMLHHVIYIEMAELLRSGRVDGCYNSKRTWWTHAGGERSPWPLLRVGEAVSFAPRNVRRQHTVSILSSSSTCPLALLYIDSLCT